MADPGNADPGTAPTPLPVTWPLGGSATSRPAVHRAAGCEIHELRVTAEARVQRRRGIGGIGDAAVPAILPTAPNTATGSDPWLLWRGPGDWHAYSLTLDDGALRAWLEERLGGRGALLAATSGATVAFELVGPAAVEVLLRDCGLDLEGDAVPVGACATTALAQLTVVLHHTGGDRWRLWGDRSAARYLWAWLVDTAGPARPAE